MKATILAIGDEIVSGLTTDMNSGFLALALRDLGVDVAGGFAVPDDDEAIRRALTRALEDAELVVTTGGLGPTADDRTTASVAALAGQDLVLDEPSLRRMEERFRERGLGEMPPNNRKQALIPSGSELIPNPVGTAVGFACPVQTGGRAGTVICLPGVPREMKRMVEDSVLPWVRARAGADRFLSRTYSVFGLTESKLDELLAGVIEPGEGRLAFRAAFPVLQTRLTLKGGVEDAELDARMERLDAAIRARLGTYVYATGDEGMEHVVGRALTDRGATLAVAESCTGGLIGHRITDVPGSSRYFLLGLVTYSNEAKRDLLGVRAETLAMHGAVSTSVAEEMAAGVRRASGATLGLATTGIAGPGGGSEEKPLGTVCIGLAWDGGTWSHRYSLGSRDREWIKQMTAQLALDRVRRWCGGESA